MDYSGKIKLLGKNYDYIIKGYEMTIVNACIDILRTHKISQIANRWIETEINEEKKLVVNLSYKNAKENAIIMNIDAYFYILDFEYEREKRKDEIHKITYRSDVIDYFFRPNKKYIKLVSNLIQTFDNGKLKKGDFKKYEFNYNNKKFIMYFGINSYLRTNERFMFDVFSSLNIECDENITFDETYEISMYIKKFLSFISNTRKVYFDEIMINRYFEKTNYKHGYFYLNHGNKENINYSNVLNYDDLKNNIEEIMQEIISDNICFTSLFQYDPNYINTIDIMNICAAFECQFERTYPKFKSKKFIDIKNDVLKQLKEFKLDYKKDKVSQEILDEIITSVKNYKDVLKSKLEYALADFEKLYTTKVRKYMDIKFDFKDNYKDMPSRIKTARNQLDHGNTNVKINYDVLTDTILLRAITYFMIFKSAGMNKTNIMKCIKKFTRFGL